MKKLTMFAAVAVLALSFASCKKDYTCECSVTVGGVTATGSTVIKDTKKKAKDACTAKATSGATCTIK